MIVLVVGVQDSLHLDDVLQLATGDLLSDAAQLFKFGHQIYHKTGWFGWQYVGRSKRDTTFAVLVVNGGGVGMSCGVGDSGGC